MEAVFFLEKYVVGVKKEDVIIAGKASGIGGF